jgi:succinate dehydrogenase / fumarate reductase membrane anchor subunit
MINATKRWIFLKISGATLVPLMLWFIINLINLYDQDTLDVVNFFTNSTSKLFV